MKCADDAKFASLVVLPDERSLVLAYEHGIAKGNQAGVVVERL